ncbi:MAG: hypothetical protein QM765_29040 [Myxococcales bacterium]
MPARPALSLIGSILIAGCAVPVHEEGVCGPGTGMVDGQCVPTVGTDGSLQCGPGTYASGGVCLPDPSDASLRCGPGTVESAGECVPAPGSTDAGTPSSCGPGTHEASGQCLPDASDAGLACGPGTHPVDGQCLPDAVPDSGAGLQCGPGTHASGGWCLPDETVDAGPTLYEVYTPMCAVPADGAWPLPFTVRGTKSDGTAALDELVLSLTRSSAGTLEPERLVLSARGGAGTLKPCNSTEADCLGTFRSRSRWRAIPRPWSPHPRS